ncbi:hypothetical protein [Pseudomonas sp. NPDC007930]|uniref:hypothetical protein n=1 Tax=Pseudomonas sp. NPDC007930 TaxID=3364417 RepID=UPI0036ED3C9D
MSAMDVLAALGWAAAAVLGIALCQKAWAAQRHARRACECEQSLARQQALAEQCESERRELASAVRAEKAHVEQLQRKVEVFRDEAQGVRAALHQVLGRLIEAQREGGLSHLRYAQLLEEYRALKAKGRPLVP